MLPDNNRLAYLFDQYLHDKASGEELEELFAYIRAAKEGGPVKDRVTSVFRQVQTTESFEEVDWDAMFSTIVGDTAAPGSKPAMKVKRMRIWKSVAAVALVLILGGAGAYFYFNHGSLSPHTAQSGSTQHDILPGGNKAVLTLSNGHTIVLDSTGKGKLAGQGNVNVVKAGSGLLIYNLLSTGNRQRAADRKKSAGQYNTLATPRGGQYRLTLSDGTKVWLNAASSIRYPVAFTGKERRVEITGEVYFEVVHNKAMPFRVQVGNEVIEDLGTRFNVNAYADEPVIKTTLVEGSVAIGNTVLQPGEQAVLTKQGRMRVIKDADVESAVAWKNGFFAFNDANLQMVMRKLSRWYDIEVIYEPGVNNDQRFSGRIDRGLTLSQILNGLKQTRAHFRIEEHRKVVILP